MIVIERIHVDGIKRKDADQVLSRHQRRAYAAPQARPQRACHFAKIEDGISIDYCLFIGCDPARQSFASRYSKADQV